jgi:CheY-like chemotaxis protein
VQPDLILLDIGLPTLDGIEAARRIREVSPKSKILFVSAERSVDVAKEALSTGASGYVVKSASATELLPSVEAVLQGRQFVSTGLTGSDLSNLRNGHTANHHERKVTLATQPQDVEVRHHHQIALYPDDAALIDGFGHFIESALKIGHAVVVITTESHRANILRRLLSDGMVLPVESERFVLLDTPDSLSPLKADLSGDPAKSARYPLVEAVNAAAKKHLHVAVG